MCVFLWLTVVSPCVPVYLFFCVSVWLINPLPVCSGCLNSLLTDPKEVQLTDSNFTSSKMTGTSYSKSIYTSAGDSHGNKNNKTAMVCMCVCVCVGEGGGSLCVFLKKIFF